MTAVVSNLGDMATHGAPPFNLTGIVGASPPHKISTIPLEPPAGIVVVDPSFPPPLRKRLRCIDAEKVQLCIMATGTQLSIFEPIRWELTGAVGHISAAKHTKFQHLWGCQLRSKIGMKVFTERFRENITVTGLHQIIDLDLPFLHAFGSCRLTTPCTRSQRTTSISEPAWTVAPAKRVARHR